MNSDSPVATPVPRLLIIALVLLAALPAHAAAGERTLPIAPLAAAGVPLGDARLSTSTAPGDVTVTVGAPAVRLPADAQLRLQSCVQTHVLGAAPASACATRTVDTAGRADPVVEAAPSASRQIARPAAPAQGWATGMVEVLRRDAPGTWRRIASSWTPGGLDAAALALDESRPLPAPGPQGVPLPGTPDGGVDTGARDALCAPEPSVAADPPPAGVIPDAAGPGSPGCSESGTPAGGVPARGVALLLHGGGWAATGSGSAAGMRADAERWRARGWRTVNATYRPCGDAVADVLWLVDRAREAAGTGLPLCVIGTSSGGHLALLAGALRPAAVDCVVDQSGPTDLEALAGESAADPNTGGQWRDGPIWAHNLAVSAFGEENLAALSPARLPVRARVLIGVGAQDWLLAPEQATAFVAAQRARDPAAPAESFLLSAGPVAWGHGTVAADALAVFHAREDALAAAAAQDRSSPPPPPAAAGPVGPPVPAAPPVARRAPVAPLPPGPAPPAARAPLRASLAAPARRSLRALRAGRPLRLVLRSSRAATVTITARLGGRVVARTVRRAPGAGATRLALRLGGRLPGRSSARGPLRLRITARLRAADAATATATRSVVLVRGA